jgi:hypothetical protein
MGVATEAGGKGQHGVSWDALQLEVLEALGHGVYRRVAPPRAPLPDEPLLHALLRAAARSADDDDAPLLCREWMPVSRLAGDAAGKRALWPRLRALRAGAGRAG